MWFKPKPDPKDALIQVLKEQVMQLRLQHDTDAQRMDRLMEAMARRAGVDLIMPAQPIPVIEKIHVPNPWKDPNPITSTFKEKQ